MFLIKFWPSKWKHVILEMFFSPTFLFGLYLDRTFKICPIDLNRTLWHLLVENINTHIPLSLFSILNTHFTSKLMTHDKRVSWFLLWHPNCECTQIVMHLLPNTLRFFKWLFVLAKPTRWMQKMLWYKSFWMLVVLITNKACSSSQWNWLQ
jgi:hypothetical protein